MGYKRGNKQDGDHFKWVINVGTSKMGPFQMGYKRGNKQDGAISNGL